MSSQPNLAIAVRDLRKTYPRSMSSKAYEALKGISLEVAEGEVFGLIGPNGAGKSTLIKILTGAMGASAGSALLFGCEVSEPQSRKGMSYVPENPSLPEYLTPLEILGMGLSMHQLKLADEKKHCLHWLDRFGLAEVAHKTVRGFSKGMAQRTALAHAMAMQPKLLILDEPLSGLDPIGRKDVVDILSEYQGGGGCIFLTSHVLHDVERLADRFGLIHKGEMRAIRSPHELAGGKEMVLVRTLGKTPVVGMTPDSADRWHGDLERENLWAMLEALRSAGHTLIEIKPTLSLESAFLAVVRGDESLDKHGS